MFSSNNSPKIQTDDVFCLMTFAGKIVGVLAATQMEVSPPLFICIKYQHWY